MDEKRENDGLPRMANGLHKDKWERNEPFSQMTIK
jgi:hypothetical protein